MPLFHIENDKLSKAKPVKFNKEKEIQKLIENNLEVVFNCRFIESEFSTGAEHAGRIDTLALSEDSNPVILEYKIVASSELINQSLYYLSWIKDHKGDFQVAVEKRLGKNIEIDWNDIRVICIAPEYKKYDIHAVKMMGTNIELWQYKYYNTNTIYLEEIFNKSTLSISHGMDTKDKNPIMVNAGKKAAMTRQTGSYSFEQHLNVCDDNLKKILLELQEYILNIDEAVEEAPKKFYIAYKVSQNFVCIEVRKSKLILFLKINPKDIDIPKNGRDVENIGHYGTGDFELTISNAEEIEKSKELIKKSFENIGG